ncbi:MAG: TolB-like 6-bladed beta-propeller domain-containing protein, partial [Bacteroidales bacterium]|nr:TolB-like 6-bladed beta-propeller domain-containing protein [Bacteroidales bacterium]
LLRSSDRSTIEVYDWDGKLIKKMKADRIINRIIVNENIGYIYAVSPDESEYVYRYEIDL